MALFYLLPLTPSSSSLTDHKHEAFNNISEFYWINHVLPHIPSLLSVKRKFFNIIKNIIQLDILSFGNFSDNFAQQMGLSNKIILSASEVTFVKIRNQWILSVFEFKNAGNFLGPFTGVETAS